MIEYVFSKYLYLCASLVTTAIFIVFFLWRKDLRKEMIKTGIAVGIIGIFSENAFFQDYWKPPLLFKLGAGGIEDFLFGLAAGGVGVALYKALFHKRLRKKKNPHYWIIPFVILSEAISIFIFHSLLNINSIFASSIGFIIPVLLIYMIRKDLILESVYSALLGGSILILGETIFLLFAPAYLEKYFLLYNKVFLVFNIAPITELVWGMALASLLGVIYEFDYGDILVNEPRHISRKRKMDSNLKPRI